MLPVMLSEPQQHLGLTLFPLVAGTDDDDGYDLLPDAIAAGTLVITEVSEAGSVPELLATNSGHLHVLVLDGMQLIGAKQNRIVSRSMVLPAGSQTRVPVSCMEQGRWRHRSHAMGFGMDHSPAKVRRQTREVEAEAAEGDPMATLARAQGRVWQSIAESARAADAYSPTGALDDVYNARRAPLQDAAARFPAVPGQVGFLALVDGVPAGADLVASPRVWARLHDQLVRGYVFDALERAGSANGRVDGNGGAGGIARAFLDSLIRAERRPVPTVGLGDYRSLVGAVVGGELELDGVVLHLSGFPVA
jgi:hypothetical protein